jgi:hypothetical protein
MHDPYFLNISPEIWQKFRNRTHEAIEQSQQAGLLLQASINQTANQNLNNFTQQYPLIPKLLQLLAWISSHPIRGIFLVLLILVLVTSLVRGIIRLIESASLLILRTPLKWIWLLIQYIFKSIFSLINKPSNNTLEQTDLEQTKQQRLIDISQRLATLQNEQQELLEEAKKLLNQ